MQLTPLHRAAVTSPSNPFVLELDRIVFERDTRRIIDDVTLRVHSDEHWAVLGANGSGKTTLLRIAAMYEHPSSGTVRVLDEELGRTDVRLLRRRVGYASAALSGEFRQALAAVDVVVTAKYAALEPWWHQYTADDYRQAQSCLDRMHVGRLAQRSIGTLSSGEQQRVFLARTLMNDPGIVLLDEPSARLDLSGREQLVDALTDLAVQPDGPPTVLATHHVDEIPTVVTHALLLRDGRAISKGPLEATLTSDTLSDCFSMPLQLERRADGRFSAWAKR